MQGMEIGGRRHASSNKGAREQLVVKRGTLDDVRKREFKFTKSNLTLQRERKKGGDNKRKENMLLGGKVNLGQSDESGDKAGVGEGQRGQ